MINFDGLVRKLQLVMPQLWMLMDFDTYGMLVNSNSSFESSSLPHFN